MEVPESTLNRTRRISTVAPLGMAASLKAARMLTPGAVISGCNTSISHRERARERERERERERGEPSGFRDREDWVPETRTRP